MSEWMLWSRFGGSIQLGSAPPPRLYLIPLSASIEHEGPLSVFMGHRNREERNLEGITRALDRAISGEYDGVIFPSTILSHPARHEVFARCQSRGLKIVHQLTTDVLSTEHHSNLKFSLNPDIRDKVRQSDEALGDPFTRMDELMRRLDAGDAVNLVFGAGSLPKDTLIARLTRWQDQVYFTYSARAADPVIELLHRLQPFVRERLFFHFPYHLEFGDGNLSCQQIYDLTERIHARVPGIRVRPMLGVESFDPRVDSELELEPVHKPVFETSAPQQANSQLEISVIIPSYNNRDYLVNTIKHLSRQDLHAGSFEVIVVDDGSNDGSQEAVQSLARPFEGRLNFKYIYSPRLKPRKMGDANYRAGISRNLGVKNSRGRILCFLDSDILTPPNYLTDLIEKHRRFDVIQCKRLNLVREKSDADVCFEQIDASQDTFSTEDGYWEKFYSVREWEKEPFFWKYTCTYGLSVPAKLFKRVGWIRKGFVFYGFEDVELGYRLAQVGSRFHLNETVTYHLFHKNERSEFHNSDYLRQALLAKTAQIFYLGRLEPEIFFHFRGLMKEQLPLSSLVKFAFRKLGIDVERSNRTSETASWLTIPFLAIWNWRWFIWRLLQKAKNSAWFKKPAAIIALGSSRVKSVIDPLIRPPQYYYQTLQLWRIKRIAALTISRLQLWRLKVAAQWIWGQRWRIIVPAKRLSDKFKVRRLLIDWLQLWRLQAAAQWIWGQRWRAAVAAKRISDKLQLWRLQIMTSRFTSQLWRFQVLLLRVFGFLKLKLSTIPFWKLRVLAESAMNQAWRLQVPAQRAAGMTKLFIARLQLWKLRAFTSNMIAQSWRLRVVTQRVAGNLKAMIYSVPVWKLKGLLWAAVYPIRKIYYVVSFQWQKRFAKVPQETDRQSGNQQERP
jgi:glycosyltransferase involved in cell wall biosynthesis